MMLRHLLTAGLLLLTSASIGLADNPDDVRAIDALNKAFVDAYDKGDAKAMAELFTEDAEISDETGEAIRGKDEIAKHFAEVFRNEPKATIELMRDPPRFLGKDSARETGRARINPADGSSPELSRFQVIYVRKNGKWLHDVIDDTADANLSPHDHLLELEWMLGDWVDESHDGVIHTSCHWSKDQNFLVRDFTLMIDGKPTERGHQRIGWDAGVDQFKSWVFDHDGGHSEGLWTRTGKKEWTIKATGRLSDGRAIEATQILTFVNKNTAKWKSTKRIIDGDAVPDLDEVTLVKTPPKPGLKPKK